MPQSSLIFRGPPFMGRGGCVRVVRLLAGISISFLFTSLRLCSFVDLFDCPPGIMEGDGKGQKPRLLNTQTTASYIPEPREMLESISRATRMQRQQNGMQDNGMERKTRPMLGAQRIYLQQGTERILNVFSEWYT